MLISIAELIFFVISVTLFFRFLSHIGFGTDSSDRASIRLVVVMKFLMFFGWTNITFSIMGVLKLVVTGEV